MERPIPKNWSVIINDSFVEHLDSDDKIVKDFELIVDEGEDTGRPGDGTGREQPRKGPRSGTISSDTKAKRLGEALDELLEEKDRIIEILGEHLRGLGEEPDAG